ncbi:uncharacterized protein VTP21DRAFT_8193 [Calcarisporiella thermophila]|uniref:uncharacterized protein n=1 Tax=Calcarisporiella thermophila TaxID=911321 RepID=UPI0037432AF5
MQTFTELRRWRLQVKHGAQVWCYSDSGPQTTCEKYHIGLPIEEARELSRPRTAQEAACNAFEFVKLLQTEDGHWAGEYGGPEFLIPGLVISYYVCETPIPEPEKLELKRYLINTARSDGGWGIHTTGRATVFGTALNYCALRLLGLEPTHPVLEKARANLHKQGGATGCASWGKFWLSLLGVYGWEGMNPVPPELWLVPDTLPLHPKHFWVHTRAIYLPMSYIYGRRLVGKETPLVHALREELYTQRYETIHWPAHRNNICKADEYTPHSTLLNIAHAALNLYENLPNSFLRKRALDKVYKCICLEDEDTSYLNIGPVNKVMHMVIRFFVDGPDSAAFKCHLIRNRDFLWLGPKGMMMSGNNGSQLWDTAFILQGALEAGWCDISSSTFFWTYSPHLVSFPDPKGLAKDPKNHSVFLKAYNFLDYTQIKCETPHHKYTFHRPAIGAWPFSTSEQGYMVSDCTAEAMKTVLYLNTYSFITQKVSKERLCQAVDILLSVQNGDGGYSTYEEIRGPAWLELLNPAELFGKIMVEYSYTECTTAILLALKAFSKFYPDYRAMEIRRCCENAFRFVKRRQNPDGSWYGSWAICFTYGTWCALEALSSIGEYYDNSECSKKGCEFLLSKQLPDGGWGESYKSCETEVYHQLESAQVVNTSWAVLALMAARYPDEAPIRRGIRLLMTRQQPNGEFKQEAVEGVFNHTCTISYPNYKFAFTLMALGRFARLYNDPIVIE